MSKTLLKWAGGLTVRLFVNGALKRMCEVRHR